MSIVYEFPDEDITSCILKARPSQFNKSPYVADVYIPSEDRDAIAHVPSLHLGGKCVPDTVCLMKFAREGTKYRKRVGKDSVSKKYGTPKCELHSCLVKYKNIWIAAHPKIGEDIASAYLSEGSIYGPVHTSKIVKCEREVSKVAGTNMRTDFLITHEDGSYSIVEVKTVVDSDSDANLITNKTGGTDAAIFPWGKKNQKYENTKVVSARAIKHICELTEIANGSKKDERYPEIRACVLFVVVRSDCKYFRPYTEACEKFSEKLTIAYENGVKLIAQSVDWRKDSENNMKCFDNGLIPIILD